MQMRVEDHTGDAIDAKDEAIKRAMNIIGMKLEKYAKALCPVGTPESTGIPGYMGGTLRNSITYVTATHAGNTVTIDDRKGDPHKKLHGGRKDSASTDEKNCVYVGTNVFYAPYVEKGTSKRRPKPFILPSVRDHMSEYEHIMFNELKKALE